ncbi:hypothetical protein Tco_1266492 [Tanacetum coccineum]
MRELREDTFSGNKNNDAHEHVERVLDIINLFNIPGVSHDAVMLRIFPITLTGAAKRWVKRLPPGTVDSWDLLKKAFIQRPTWILHTNGKSPTSWRKEAKLRGAYEQTPRGINMKKDRDGRMVKDLRERNFGDYKWMFDLEIDHLADKYELGIGKKGHMLEDIWENYRKVQGNNTYWWHDQKSKEDERRKLGINIEEMMDSLPMGRENGSRFRDMIRFLYEETGIRGLFNSFSCAIKVLYRRNHKGSGYQQKDRKPSQNDKTEHGMEKTVQNQGQSLKMPKSESILKNQQSNRSRN